MVKAVSIEFGEQGAGWEAGGWGVLSGWIAH